MVVIVMGTGCVKGNVEPVRPGVFLVTARAAPFATEERTQDEVDKRARRTCPNGYRTLERTFSHAGPRIAETIECKTWATEAARPPAPPRFPRPEAQGPELAEMPTSGWSCTHVVGNSNLGQCRRSPQSCEELRQYMSLSSKEMTACRSQAAAFCFDLRSAPDQAAEETCSPNPEGCSERLDYEVKTRGRAAAASACEPR